LSQILHYLSFCAWIISMSTMFCSSIYVVGNDKIFMFLRLYSILLCINTTFFYPFVNRYLGCVHILAIMSNIAVTVKVQIHLPTYQLQFLWTEHRSGIAQFHGYSIFS
jgi:hypothetical protein